jgi:chorismate synthase
MASNSFGNLFRITTFGESHGPAMGVVIDGCPAGVAFDEDLLKRNLSRRRPGSSPWVSARNEEDSFEVLSGIYEGKSLGTPIAINVRNKDQRSEDYKSIQKGAYRPGHADDLWASKYNQVDLRGGGRASGRETLCRVIAGSIAEMFVNQQFPEIKVRAFASQIFKYKLDATERESFLQSSRSAHDFIAAFPNTEKAKTIGNLLVQAKSEGKSYGGLVDLFIQKAPKALGQPVFNKLKSDLARALMSIGAVSSLQLGIESDFSLEGTEFHKDSKAYGGIRGGLSTGEDIAFQLGFKPTSSVLDVAKKGRHDPCIIPRAIAVVEAMSYLVLADHLLWARLDNTTL